MFLLFFFFSLPPHPSSLLLKVALEHYGEALACGNQFIYQSMPRFLTLWLDYGAEFAQKQETTATTITGNTFRAGASETGANEDTSAATFDEVQALMRASLQKIPPYQFYTALGQILSRVCHEHPSIVNMLVDLIVRVQPSLNGVNDASRYLLKLGKFSGAVTSLFNILNMRQL
ncbi:unnamed protein product [Dibothriocephalus latus]|uniref:Serine/threonine-protein kinase ATR-like HEAT repeats domain-containing protein n=1 Tax=Dibothriocephalus latus TaxID=60516 RepID=A0A3P7LGX9_DIBLA|nr:unnamed protein product [Dibothriocephalus latus]